MMLTYLKPCEGRKKPGATLLVKLGENSSDRMVTWTFG